MTDHIHLAARLPLGSDADGGWSVVAPAAAARSVAFLAEANGTGTMGAGEGASAPAYVPSVSIAA